LPRRPWMPIRLSLMRKQPTVVVDCGGRGQVMSTVDDDRQLLISLSVQLCIQRDR